MTRPGLTSSSADDRRYFEQLLGAILQAGLGWPTIESHGPAFSKVFDDFDPREVAAMTDNDLEHAAQDPGIVRNRRKIKAAVASAATTNSFDAYLRSFEDPKKRIQDRPHHRFAGRGDDSAWWFLQSVGLPVPPSE